MPTEKKIEQVKELEDKLRRCKVAIGAEFRGITVHQMDEVRRILRAKGIEMEVVKNTLVGIAGDRAGVPKVREVLKGPTIIAFGYKDPAEPAKILTEHIRAARVPITINGALVDGQVVNAAGVQQLATLPAKPVLVSQLMGNMLGPVSGLVYALNFHIGGLARVLDARRKQLEETPAPA